MICHDTNATNHFSFHRVHVAYFIVTVFPTCGAQKFLSYSGVSIMQSSDSQGFIQRGGRGGFIPLMILARGGYPPHQTAEQCFFNGHFSEVLQESVQKTNPFLANLCFLIVPPPHKFFSGGNPDSEFV